MTSLDTYLNLCTQVYDISKPTPPQDAYEFYRSYAASANGRILEPMCGTGRFLLPLIEEGFDVYGFDGSQSMLDALHKKANEKSLKVNTWFGLIEEINIREKYKLIFIPSGSFCLITDLQAAKRALKKFYDFLEKDGTLVFEVETLKSVPMPIGLWRGSLWEKEDGKIIIGNFLTLPMEDNVSNVICRYELIDKNLIIKTEVEKLRVKIYDLQNLYDILTEIGFTQIKMLKAFDRIMQPSDDDESIIFECIK
jgi:SAM-dependent methyltransferase